MARSGLFELAEGRLCEEQVGLCLHHRRRYQHPWAMALWDMALKRFTTLGPKEPSPAGVVRAIQ